MFGIIANFLGYQHNINSNMSQNVLNIRIFTNYVANNINTNMSHMYGKCYSKTRVMLLHHPQGGKQKLGPQAHYYGAPTSFLL